MIRRGAFVTVVTSGDYGKPRPALVVQSNLFDALPSVVVLPLTSTLRDDVDQIRIDVEPSDETGLRERSQIALDKITVVSTAKVGKVIGAADEALMLRVTRAMALLLGMA